MPADFDPSIQSEEIGFKEHQLVLCDACGRQNPPNRLECLYCGAGLSVRPDVLDKIIIRKLEAWEPGINVVVTGGGGGISAAADLLALDAEQLHSILESGIQLPVARLDGKTAEIVTAQLGEMGFETRQVADSVLAPARSPVRLSAMELDDEAIKLVDFNTRETTLHSWSELLLIVTGAFSTGKIDSMEKRRLRKTTVMSETTTSADESVFDLYTSSDKTGYRVHLAGFDYSCLGDRMAPLATENMSRLIEVIRERARQLKVIDDYKRIRPLLTGIWDVESRKDAQGLKQVGFGKREFGVVHSTNNVEQFTRFSRLQRLMS